MKTYEESAYVVAALGAAGVAIRLLLSKGLVGRDEAVRALLDEAVSRAIFAETGARGEIEPEMNRQSAEILKFMAQDL